MTDVIFGLIIIALLVWHYFDRKETTAAHQEALGQAHDDYLKNLSENIAISEETITQLRNIVKDLSKERQTEKESFAKLVNALIAKNAVEARDLGLADVAGKFVEQPQSPEVPPDLVPVDQLPQDEWEKHVLGKAPEDGEEVEE